jgi:hypothetical protein
MACAGFTRVDFLLVFAVIHKLLCVSTTSFAAAAAAAAAPVAPCFIVLLLLPLLQQVQLQP